MFANQMDSVMQREFKQGSEERIDVGSAGENTPCLVLTMASIILTHIVNIIPVDFRDPSYHFPFFRKLRQENKRANADKANLQALWEMALFGTLPCSGL